MKSLYDAFAVESPLADTRKVPLDMVCPVGQETSVVPNPSFMFEYRIIRRALKNISACKPIWCWGPSGCGKTELFVQIAARLQRSCVTISFGEEMSLRELMGTIDLVSDGNGSSITRYRHGQLTQAMQVPMTIIILDEFNMAPPGVAAQFNRLLETGELTIPETGETVKSAEGVVFVVTANTAGSMDETGTYAGSQIQNGATRTRFTALRVNYMPADREAALLRKAYPNLDKEIVLSDAGKNATEVFVEVGNAIRSLNLSLPFSVRALKEWGESSLILKDVKEGFADAYYDLLAPSEAVSVASVFHKITGLKLEHAA